MTPSFIKSYFALQPLAGRRFVMFTNVVARQVDVAVSPASVICGVTDSQGAKNAGDLVDVHLGGLYEVEAGAAFAAGEPLTADASGRAVRAALNGTNAVHVGARALGAAVAAGDIVPVYVNPHRTPLVA